MHNKQKVPQQFNSKEKSMLEKDIFTYALLGQSQSALILADLQQLNNALLIRSQTGHLTDHLSDGDSALVGDL